MLAKTVQRVVLAREAKNADWPPGIDPIFLLGTFLSYDLYQNIATT
jgi:hypothetical protein